VKIDIRPASIAQLVVYAEIPSTFEVTEVLDVSREPGRDGLYELSARPALTPYVKDYDGGNGGPPGWAMRFNMATWGIFIAHLDGKPVGAAAVAAATPDLDLLSHAADTAVLWDIRVAASARRQGVGNALFEAVESWAVAEGCRRVVIETQNVNVPACRFYEQCGCVLRKVRHEAYLDRPDEVQMLWEKRFETMLGT
jgi:GNAT superfamily N-acetyltransferase